MGASANVNPKENEHYCGGGSPNCSYPERFSISMVLYYTAAFLLESKQPPSPRWANGREEENTASGSPGVAQGSLGESASSSMLTAVSGEHSDCHKVAKY